MNVTWTKLSLEEARGFITRYTVSYDILESRRRREALVEFVNSESSYKVIGGLGITMSYSVTVSGSTTAGEGLRSPPIVLNGNVANNDIYSLMKYHLSTSHDHY